MGNEIFEALKLLEKERGIAMDFMLEKINKAIVTACKNSYDGNEHVEVMMDEKTGLFEVDLYKTVCEEMNFPGREISLTDAKKINKKAKIGEEVKIVLDTKEFGRIADAVFSARTSAESGTTEGKN